MKKQKLIVTKAAQQVIQRLKEEYKELVFILSGGCCEGTSPMCYAKDDFYLPSSSIKIGEIYSCEFFINRDLFEYFKNSHITLDVKEEMALGNSFSLEIDLGYQFFINSEIIK